MSHALLPMSLAISATQEYVRNGAAADLGRTGTAEPTSKRSSASELAGASATFLVRSNQHSPARQSARWAGHPSLSL